MTAARQRVGRRGEDAAAQELCRGGWRLVARNARVPGIRGELDIVAVDPGGELVIVEVKTLSAGNLAGPASPLELVGPRKRAQLRRLAGAWVEAHRGRVRSARGLRIDVVGVRLALGGRVRSLEHVRAAC